MAKDIAIVIFSKNRALQLDLCLNSLYKYCEDLNLAEINVIYKADKEHKSSYQTLMNEHLGANVIFIRESNFKLDLTNCLSNKTYVLFATDDNIFINKFSLGDATDLLLQFPTSLGLSLRLGKNTNYCYPLDVDQKVPMMSNVSQDICIYYWANSEHDFGYPLEVSSSIYRIKDIMMTIKRFDVSNPNILETLLHQDSMIWLSIKPMLMCYNTSRAFCNPINMVQNIFHNRSGNNSNYYSDKLLSLYNSGHRINVKDFENFIPSAAHQIVGLRIVEENSHGQ